MGRPQDDGELGEHLVPSVMLAQRPGAWPWLSELARFLAATGASVKAAGPSAGRYHGQRCHAQWSASALLALKCNHNHQTTGNVCQLLLSA